MTGARASRNVNPEIRNSNHENFNRTFIFWRTFFFMNIENMLGISNICIRFESRIGDLNNFFFPVRKDKVTFLVKISL